MGEMNGRVTHVLLLEVDKEIVLKRIAGRRICRDCGGVFHITGNPPKEDGVCDSCGGEVYQRADDNEVTVLNRLEIYKAEIIGLVDYYKKKNLLVYIDAADRMETKNSILEILDRP